MTVLYTLCLVGLFCSVILVWKARYTLLGSFNAPMEHFKQANDLKCIINKSWANVLSMWT